MDDVARQVSAAIDKASEARDSLAQADDLAEEAHDELAVTLRGARSDLSSDVEHILAMLINARDGMRGLFGILNRGRGTAERYLSTLTGEGTPEQGPAPQRPAQPSQQSAKHQPASPFPAHQAEPSGPPVIPPERVEELRRELPPPVVPNSGQKTVGRWIGPDGTAEPIQSGFDQRSALVQSQLARMGLPEGSGRSGDVE
uniref:hypothetical protein n=1 Tax=Saccharothrix mutabilis TaxID=33921 RepID=UPI0031D7B615